MELWNNKLFKLQGERIIDSLLTILSHLLKAEALIEKYLAKKQNEASVSGASSAATAGTSFSYLPRADENDSVVVDGGASSTVDGSRPQPPPSLFPAAQHATLEDVLLAVEESLASVDQPRDHEANPVDEEYLGILLEMGFPREIASAVLVSTGHDILQSTDILLRMQARNAVSFSLFLDKRTIQRLTAWPSHAVFSNIECYITERKQSKSFDLF